MPQKHDQRWKKKQPGAAPITATDTNRLAAELVERGLASPLILDYRPTFSRSKETTP